MKKTIQNFSDEDERIKAMQNEVDQQAQALANGMCIITTIRIIYSIASRPEINRC